jgi:nucleoside-diphosphate-sugar epimerase
MTYTTVVIFGGDTDPGYRLAQRLAAAGREVIAAVRFLRDRSYLDRLGAEIVYCDPTRREEVEQFFACRNGADLAVVCILGGTPQLNTQGNINVIDAAANAGVTRIVITTSIGCGDSAEILDPFVKAVAGRAIRAKEWAENHLRASGLDWTIVRSGGTMRRAGSGEAILTDSTAVTGYINLGDLGDMLFVALESDKLIGKAVAAVDPARAHNVNGTPLIPAEV